MANVLHLNHFLVLEVYQYTLLQALLQSNVEIVLSILCKLGAQIKDLFKYVWNKNVNFLQIMINSCNSSEIFTMSL